MFNKVSLILSKNQLCGNEKNQTMSRKCMDDPLSHATTGAFIWSRRVQDYTFALGHFQHA
jgi:hypothetical protein